MAKVISIEDAAEGMITCEPVLNNHGQTLLPSGISLSSNHLRILKTWNIRSLFIKTEESEEDNLISEELMKLTEEKLTKRMRWEPRNSIENDLFQAAIMMNALRLSKSK